MGPGELCLDTGPALLLRAVISQQPAQHEGNRHLTVRSYPMCDEHELPGRETPMFSISAGPVISNLILPSPLEHSP